MFSNPLIEEICAGCDRLCSTIGFALLNSHTPGEVIDDDKDVLGCFRELGEGSDEDDSKQLHGCTDTHFGEGL
jgi:hypothetical protein